MSSNKMAQRQSQNSARKKISEVMSADLSPDSKCPICLDTFNNISYLDLCLHKFCFRCIHEWSKNKAECPLCKQPFNSIYHSIKSEQEFKKYDLQPVGNGSFGTFGGARFRYRTTLTGVHRQAQRRTSTPPDNGVMFEGSGNPPQQWRDRSLRHIMMSLAARRRAASEGREVRRVTEQQMVNFRRELYRQGVRVRNVRDGGRSRDTTAEFYRRNPACLHRLVPWLKRELIVLYGSHGSLVNIVQHIIMSRITRYDMEDGAMEEELRPFLQGRAEHFLHEFISFAKSPFNMEAYDQHAVYDCPAPSSNEDSSSSSSVIAISEDEQNSLELDPPGNSMSSLSQSAWDDETPGPSYSTTEENRVQRLSVPDSDSDSSVEEEPREYDACPQHRSPHNQTELSQAKVEKDECLSSDSDDCVIVGFVKPTAERTPELVQLSSNSDESDHEETKEQPQLPQHIRFTSLSPPTSPSRESNGAGQSESRERDRYQSDSKERCSPSTSRHKPSSKSERRNRDRHGRHSRRYHSRDRSGERHRSRNRDRKRRRSRSEERSRSPLTLSRSRRHSRSSSRDRWCSRWDSDDKRRDRGFSRNTQSHSYHSQSYSCYNQERDHSGTHYKERWSYYSSCRRNSARRSNSRSRSHSGESHRRNKKHSRSRTDSSSCSPSPGRRSHHDKPAGKRKYKTRHLEETANSPPFRSYPEPDSSTSLKKENKKSKEKHKKSKEKSRRRSRSLSVEIICEGSSSKRSKRHHKKKKKHKKKSKRHRSKEHTGKHSPTVITIDSDSDFVDDNVVQASSTNKDNSVNNTTDNRADSLLQHVEDQIPTAGAVRDVSAMDSLPADQQGLLP